MSHYEYPLIGGTVEKQLSQIKSFLYRQAEKLNYNYDNVSVEKFWERTASVMTMTEEKQQSEVQKYKDEYKSLRSLIISSATEVIKHEATFSKILNGDYLAKSDFGEYFEKATVLIEETPYGIKQLYNFSSEIKKLTGSAQTAADNAQDAADGVGTALNKYKLDVQNYINMGYLDTDTTEPTFGIDIGLKKNEFKVIKGSKEETIANETPHFVRITPKGIYFFTGTHKVASIEEEAISFPNANITGGTINISSGKFSVSSDGKLVASSADIAGKVTATSGSIGGWTLDSNRLYKGTWGTDGAVMLCPNGSENSKSIAGSDKINGWTITSGSKFGVTKNGVMYAEGVRISGNVTATSGSIGGWTIGNGESYVHDTSSLIMKKVGNYEIGMKATTGDDASSSVAFYVYHKTKDYQFYVNNSGKLLAKNAEIEGKVTATSGSIGGWSIGTAYSGASAIVNTAAGYEVGMKVAGSSTAAAFYVNQSGKNTFYIRQDGYLYAQEADIAGKITASEGKIGRWIITADGIKSTSSSNYTVEICNYNNTNDTSRIFRCYDSSGNDIFCVKRNGRLEASNAALEGSLITTSGSMRAVVNGGIIQLQTKGSNSWTAYGSIYALDGFLKLKGAASVIFESSGRFDFSFYDGSKSKTLLSFYEKAEQLSSLKLYYIDAKSVTLNIDTVNYSSLNKTSDRRLKENITDIDKKYELLFESFKAVSFNYIDSKINQIGFIAQDVLENFKQQGLDSTAFVKSVSNDDKNLFALDYTMFIPFNTHMIQKCLKEIAQLKEEISMLKAERN